MAEIFGNIKGIKDVVLEELKQIYEMPILSGQLVSADIASKLANVSEYINKEISLYIARDGTITSITIGNTDSVELPSFEGKRGQSRLSGVRCVHTHLGGNSALSGVDYSALKNSRFDAMITIGVVGPDFSKSLVSFGMYLQWNCSTYCN